MTHPFIAEIQAAIDAIPSMKGFTIGTAYQHANMAAAVIPVNDELVLVTLREWQATPAERRAGLIEARVQ